MYIVGVILLIFILLFIYCSLKVASISDEVIENNENN